jgi:hypothetical protein
MLGAEKYFLSLEMTDIATEWLTEDTLNRLSFPEVKEIAKNRGIPVSSKKRNDWHVTLLSRQCRFGITECKTIPQLIDGDWVVHKNEIYTTRVDESGRYLLRVIGAKENVELTLSDTEKISVILNPKDFRYPRSYQGVSIGDLYAPEGTPNDQALMIALIVQVRDCVSVYLLAGEHSTTSTGLTFDRLDTTRIRKNPIADPFLENDLQVTERFPNISITWQLTEDRRKIQVYLDGIQVALLSQYCTHHGSGSEWSVPNVGKSEMQRRYEGSWSVKDVQDLADIFAACADVLDLMIDLSGNAELLGGIREYCGAS